MGGRLCFPVEDTDKLLKAIRTTMGLKEEKAAKSLEDVMFERLEEKKKRTFPVNTKVQALINREWRRPRNLDMHSPQYSNSNASSVLLRPISDGEFEGDCGKFGVGLSIGVLLLKEVKAENIPVILITPDWPYRAWYSYVDREVDCTREVEEGTKLRVVTQFKYLGIQVALALTRFEELNLEPLITKIRTKISAWSKLNLSVVGRVNLLKMVVMPQILYVLHNSPAVGFSCIPNNKDEDGLVELVFNKKEADIRAQQQQLVESLHKVLGGHQTLTVNVEGVKALPDDQTEVIIYVVERSPNGTSRRVSATIINNYFEQNNIKSNLQQLGVTLTIARTELSPAQIKHILQNPPAGVELVIWDQAKIDNPEPDRMIPVAMVGFKELLRRLKVQDQMTKQHQSRLDIISEDISELQKNQATTMAKIAQYKRKLMELSHRVLQVLIKQEIQRKGGFAIQAEEEQLRVQLDTIQSELNAPTQFKGRLNELMSQIRMQNHFGAVRSEEKYYVDGDLLREIKQHLKQQQEGLSHLIGIIKDDLEDIKLIEQGLSDNVHIRGGMFS
ncbi:unnamed protein product [Ranitomeya imitator]|uniref:Uncharacterized protein n=1 Tax=Ranitomeya imitator TaxID=111125 RepID=A0ABN9KU10_9NEOB|nr:unnamed protein product [Ranitomeya imitator]